MKNILSDPRFAGIKPFENKVWLASPTMHGEEQAWINDAFEKNWITTAGENINEIEKLIQEDHINRTNQKRKKKSKRMIPNLKKEIKIKQKKTKLKKKKKKILLASIDGNSEDPKVKKLQVKL